MMRSVPRKCDYYEIAFFRRKIFFKILVFSDERSRSIISNLLPIPRKFLISSGISFDDYENNIIKFYKKLNGTSQGNSILKFVLLLIDKFY